MSPHILFVDDEAPIRELLSLFFRKKGLEVTTARTAKAARELAETTNFSLAILDVQLEEENGLDLLSFFKSKHPKMPVIIFTGAQITDELVERARSGGANGFMRKNEPLDALLAEVQRNLGGA